MPVGNLQTITALKGAMDAMQLAYDEPIDLDLYNSRFTVRQGVHQAYVCLQQR
ncbi:MAG: hypothetical protein WKF37_05395 [Bryobacteraceae bacterium]